MRKVRIISHFGRSEPKYSRYFKLSAFLENSMDSFLENAPKIIEEAAKSTLGLFALMILVLAFLSYTFFRHASIQIRTTIFILMFIGAMSYGFTIFRTITPTYIEKIPLSENFEKPPKTEKPLTIEISDEMDIFFITTYILSIAMGIFLFLLLIYRVIRNRAHVTREDFFILIFMFIFIYGFSINRIKVFGQVIEMREERNLENFKDTFQKVGIGDSLKIEKIPKLSIEDRNKVIEYASDLKKIESEKQKLYESWESKLSSRIWSIKPVLKDASYVKLGQVAFINNNLDESEEHFKKALKEEPKNIDALNNLSVTYFTKIQTYQEALKIYTIEKHPLDYAKTKNNLGIAYSDLATVTDKEDNLIKAIQASQGALKTRVFPRSGIKRKT
jgi:hypothetical protein